MTEASKSIRSDLAAVALLALGVRLAFIFYAGPHVYGDGTGYPRQGMQIATGQGQLDTSWLGAYSFWLAAVYSLIPSLKWTAIIGALIPGVLLVTVAQVIGLRLYGRSTGLLCGLFCALHPLLITYSTNGYMETFYCLLLAVATLALCELLRIKTNARRRAWALLAGVAMALVFATRNEALPLALAVVLVPLFAVAAGSDGPSSLWRARLVDCATVASGLLVGVGLYVVVAFASTGSVGLFGKAGNLSRHSDIFLQREAAAAEVYGAGGIIERSMANANGQPDSTTATEEIETGYGVKATTLAKRFWKNLLSALPGSAVRLFASPLPLLALIPIFGWMTGKGWRRELIPPCLMLVFFPAFFSLYAVQPRYLMPIVVPVHLFGAAGTVTLAAWLCRRRSQSTAQASARKWLVTATTSLLVLLAAATLWKGNQIRAERILHSELAAWLREQVPLEEKISGCGFGHIGDTTFRSGHAFLVRLHTDEPQDLEQFVRQNTDGWLVLYEDYLSDANPAMLRYLEDPLPGFRRRHEVSVKGAWRAQVFQLENTSIADRGADSTPAP